jgi:hypothetical protein
MTCQVQVPTPYEEQSDQEPARKKSRMDHRHILDDFAPNTAEDSEESFTDPSSRPSCSSIIISNVPPSATSRTLQLFVERSLRKHQVQIVGGCNVQHEGHNCLHVRVDLATNHQARMALNLNFVVWEGHTIYVKPWNPLVLQPQSSSVMPTSGCGWPMM